MAFETRGLERALLWSMVLDRMKEVPAGARSLTPKPFFTGTRVRRLDANAPAAGAAPFLKDYGGPVLSDARTHLIFLGQYWTGQGAADQQYIQSFAQQLGGSALGKVLSQYRGAAPPAWVRSTVHGAFTGGQVTEATLQQVIATYANDRTLPANTVHTVVLPPGAVLVASDGSTSLNGLGGYHGRLQGLAGQPLYAAIAPDGIQISNQRRDAATMIMSHELSETVTDPNVEQNQLSFYDQNYGEIGDIAMSQLPLNQVWTRQNGYAVQYLWSNKDGAYSVGDNVLRAGSGTASGPSVSANSLPELDTAVRSAAVRFGVATRTVRANALGKDVEAALNHLRRGDVVAATGRSGLLPYGFASGPVTLTLLSVSPRGILVEDPRHPGRQHVIEPGDLRAFIRGSPMMGSLVALHT